MRSRRSILAGGGVALASVLAHPAAAHGPTRQKLVETVAIAAPPEKVWAVVGHFHDLAWLPPVERVAGDGGDVAGAKRQVFLKSGGALDEELTKYDAAGMAYSTFLPHNDPKVLPVTNLSTDLKVEPGEGGGAKVTWRGAFYRGDPNGNPPPGMDEAAAIAAVKAYFQAGLAALKRMAEAAS